ncbi:MAG: hypothetical protein ACLFRP_06980 [Puniceicoccaceae bacterium]
MPPEPARRKKKVDYEALHAPLMQIPRMKVEVVRALLDLGIRETYELTGRAPEVLFEEARARSPGLPPSLLAYFRMAVYFAETPDPDPALLHPQAWAD